MSNDFEEKEISSVKEKTDKFFQGVGEFTFNLWIVVTQKKDDPFIFSRFKSAEAAHAFQAYRLLAQNYDRSIVIPIELK